jgi:hypothetical protein
LIAEVRGGSNSLDYFSGQLISIHVSLAKSEGTAVFVSVLPVRWRESMDLCSDPARIFSSVSQLHCFSFLLFVFTMGVIGSLFEWVYASMQQLFTLRLFGYPHMHLRIQVYLFGWWVGVLIWFEKCGRTLRTRPVGNMIRFPHWAAMLLRESNQSRPMYSA